MQEKINTNMETLLVTGQVLQIRSVEKGWIIQSVLLNHLATHTEENKVGLLPHTLKIYSR